MVEKFPSIKINTYLPDFFRRDSQELYTFMKYYFEWLETSPNVTYQSRRLLEFGDVDITPELFMTFLKNEFLNGLTNTLFVDERFLIKHIQDFYRAKGSQRAVELLFLILYGESIEVYYPGKDILRASDGRWVIEKSIVTESYVSSFTDSADIVGTTSGAKARIEKVIEYFDLGVLKTEIFLTNLEDTFIQNEFIVYEGITGNIAKVLSSGVVTKDGRFVGTNGFLSSDKYLQDNFYYQEYSFDIKSSQPIAFYRDTVNRYAQPAGTLMFGSINIESILMQSQVDISLEFGDASTGSYVLQTALDLKAPYDLVGIWSPATGTVNANTGALAILSGTGTLFEAEITSGDLLEIRANTSYIDYEISKTINSNTSLTLSDKYPNINLANGVLYYKANTSIIDSFIYRNRYLTGTGTVSTIATPLLKTAKIFDLNKFLKVPLSEMQGQINFVQGSGTVFETQLENFEIIEFNDTLNSDTPQHYIRTIASNTYLMISKAYEYGATSGMTYKYYEL